MKWISILLFLLLSACASQPKPTYLKYAGYIEGCADGVIEIVFAFKPEIDEINPVFVDSLCMEKYILKLESENIEIPMRIVDKNEAI